jgi:hypothetical protein
MIFENQSNYSRKYLKMTKIDWLEGGAFVISGTEHLPGSA